jgi:hypothetical protein
MRRKDQIKLAPLSETELFSMLAFTAAIDECFKARPNPRKIEKLKAEAKPFTDRLVLDAAATMPPKRARIAKSVLQKDEHKWLGQMGVSW